MKNFIKKHPITDYNLIAFGWTWILVFGLILSGGVKDISQPTPAFIIVGLLCNMAPSIAAFIVTRITKGKEGIMEGLWRLYDSGISGYRVHQPHLTDIDYGLNICKEPWKLETHDSLSLHNHGKLNYSGGVFESGIPAEIYAH